MARLKATGTQYSVRDADLRGHYVRVSPAGSKSFAAVARNPEGKQIWATIGRADALTIEDARSRARKAIDRIKAGLPAFEAPPPKVDTFGAVAENWMKRHVERKGLRSARAYRQILERHVLPAWRDREIDGIRRSDVTALLDEVQDGGGDRMADYVLALVRSVMNWHAARTDDFTPPIARGMRRAAGGGRDRILDDDELRLIWHAAEGTFGGIVKLLLLTAQRREKVMAMRWADLDGAVWRVPTEDREKGSGGVLVLPDAAVAVIEAQPRIGRNPYVFASRRGRGHFSGMSAGKRALAARVKIPHWVLHDLRRSARSLMPRAGVRPDIAERVLGHAIAGVEGVYDRHQYRDEKAEALRRLAALVESIVDPIEGNVVEIGSRA